MTKRKFKKEYYDNRPKYTGGNYTVGKKIKLTKGKYVLVDDEDFEWLNQWKWYFDGRYAVRRIRENKNKKTIRMHRLINNTPEGMETDHINRDKLDNRKSNLRNATSSQNKVNRGLLRNNTSGYKGVVWDKRSSKWQAQIDIDRKHISLGYYDEKEKASVAYNQAIRKYYGEFARLNNVQ